MDWKNQLSKTPYLVLFIALISIQFIVYSDLAFADFIFSIPPVIGPSSSDDGKFDLPNDVAIDSLGNIYVSDAGNNRVQKFDSAGVFISKFGSGGSGNGQFNNAFGIAIDSFDNIYVVDSGNNRVQKFNSAGIFLLTFGIFGFNDGQFLIPFEIAVDSSDNIYVTDSGNSRVQKFDSAGVFQSKFGSGGFGAGQFTILQGIDLDISGNIYVADSLNHRIQKFDSGGNFIFTFGWGVNSGANEFEICISSCQQGIVGLGDGQFNIPTDIAIDSFGNIHVVDSVSDRVQKFNSAGSFISKFGASSSANGEFNGPQGITSDSSDKIYVVDRGNNRIQKFGDNSCVIPISGVWIVTQDCEISTDVITPASVMIQNSSVVTVNSEGSLTIPAGENVIVIDGSGLKLILGSALSVLS